MHLPPTFPRPDQFGAAGSGRRLRSLDDFGSNPGKLKAWHFGRPDTVKDVPLVVVLHGCTQTASGYDSGSGWSRLAEAYGFAVLFPEQQRPNNANLCFNWFAPAQTRRGSGEALSIAQMIDAMIERHGVDRQRVFITGLSAGGAMTSAMLAGYPEKFAGGAILAGLPYGAAATVPEAFAQMRGHTPSSRTTGRAIKSASGYAGRWPAVSIWHGTADQVVNQSNADAIVGQWRDVHGLPETPSDVGRVDGHPYRAWRDASGQTLVEEYRVDGMGHGTPLATTGECGCGQAGAFMLEAGISSTVHSARSWGLLKQRCAPLIARADETEGTPPWSGRDDIHAPAASHITDVIQRALKSAGLLK